jgi:hypothetical protein
MLPQLAQGPANKIFVIPGEFTQALGNLTKRLGPGDGPPPKPPKPPRPRAISPEASQAAAADAEAAAKAAREAAEEASSAQTPEVEPPPTPSP